MKKKVKLKNGTDVTIRPMRKKDLDRSHTFFQNLPAEDREYLRVDVTKREIVKKRIRAMKSGKIKRLVSVVDDEIVAEGSLEMETNGWKGHIGELRLIVASSLKRKGLGMLMARELYFLAASNKLEEVTVEMMRPQKAAQNIFKKLGFREEAILPDYVKDISGKKQDLIVMVCDLKEMWQELEDYLEVSDWQRTR
ncbi:MAG: GNAT family N-acetyltransferase [Candidatus Marinimicrobia bacterium]|nr:GNAT family N-acetyltransferase [Candidatus Neomarinimicrobiota bacterium]